MWYREDGTAFGRGAIKSILKGNPNRRAGRRTLSTRHYQERGNLLRAGGLHGWVYVEPFGSTSRLPRERREGRRAQPASVARMFIRRWLRRVCRPPHRTSPDTQSSATGAAGADAIVLGRYKIAVPHLMMAAAFTRTQDCCIAGGRPSTGPPGIRTVFGGSKPDGFAPGLKLTFALGDKGRAPI